MPKKAKNIESPIRASFLQTAMPASCKSESPPHKKLKTNEDSPDDKPLEGLSGWYMK